MSLKTPVTQIRIGDRELEEWRRLASTGLGTHASQHENGGTDEISVLGLSGLLADAQTPLAHKTSHQDGGSDELDVTDLSGLLADLQTPLDHLHTTAGDGGGGLLTGYLDIPCANSPLTGNLGISKADPTLTFTDTGDSESAYFTRSDTSGNFCGINSVFKPSGTGNAIQCTVGSQYIDVPDFAALALDDFTFHLLVYHTRDAQTEDYWGQDANPSSDAGNCFLLRRNTSNQFAYLLNVPGGGAWTVNSFTTDTITKNTWVQIIFRRSGSTLSGFINGVAMTLTVSSCTGTLQNSSSPMRLMNEAYIAGANSMQGKVEEFALWSKALSNNDCADLYNGGSFLYLDPASTLPTDGTTIGTNLECLYHCNESGLGQAPGGTDLTDSSGNARHGTASSDWTALNYVSGLLTAPAEQVDVEFICCEDGTNPREGGVVTIGGDGARVVVDGGRIADTGIRFALDGTDIAFFDNFGTLNLDCGSRVYPQLVMNVPASVSATAHPLVVRNPGGTDIMAVLYNGGISILDDNVGLALGAGPDTLFYYNGGDLVIDPQVVGTGRCIIDGPLLVKDKLIFTQLDNNEYIDSLTDGWMDYSATSGHRFRMSVANTDVVNQFIGTTNSGEYDWMEDEDYFLFQDDILMNTSENLYFRNTATYINSTALNYLDENAATGIRFRIGGTEQLSIIDGVIQPTTDNDIDHGDNTHYIKNVYAYGYPTIVCNNNEVVCVDNEVVCV